MSFVDGSPHKSVEIKVNGMVVSFGILSEVAKVNSSVGVVVCVPMCIL